MNAIARHVLFVSFASLFAAALFTSLIDLAIWVENPDYWKPITLGHDMIGSELRHDLWKLRRENWLLFLWPLVPMLLILFTKRSLFWTGLGIATIVAFVTYYVSLTIGAWPFLTAGSSW